STSIPYQTALKLFEKIVETHFTFLCFYRMSWEKGSPQCKSDKSEEDPTKVVKIDFKKVDKLDITVLCSICQQTVHISEILFHKKVHQALAVLDYHRPWVESIDVNKIVLQRKRLLLKMKKYKTPKYVERKTEKIGCSFDLLKESMKPTPYFCIDSIAQSSVHVEEVTNPLIKAIAICQDKNARWHENLEDVFVVLDNYGNRAGTSFLGVFDGSDGISAAETTSVELPVLLLDQLSHEDPSYQVSEAGKEFIDSFCTVFRADYIVRERLFTQKGARGKKSWPGDYEWIHRAYAKSFWRMDRVCWSSCTAATCIIENISNEKEITLYSDKLCVCFLIVGNVHAVLCKNGKSYWVTKEHSTYSREERIRVLKNGGYISSNEPKGLIEGLIKSTRGLGHHGNPKLKNTVIPVPHTISFPVDDSCQFLILASNGLWEVLDKSEAVLLTLTMFSAYLEKYQRSQLKKARMPKGSELPSNDLETEFYSWYLNKDFLADIDLQNLRSSSSVVTEQTLTPEFAINVEEPEPESSESSQISEDSEINSRTFYALAAKYISKHLVETALKAGSRDNITTVVLMLHVQEHHLLLF
uniref:PPM-type phosphatase domain-containing protein n=1 Tax=Podarcis muralis TaxID=64176 RepID=A0A670K1X6_PODMU